MNEKESTSYIGVARERKPWTAANLSIFFSGLGQVYCGDVRGGLLYMSGFAALMLAMMGAAVIAGSWGWVALVVSFLAIVVLSTVSSVAAFRTARRTRADYRLKDYNRVSVYVALSFFMLIALLGLMGMIRGSFLEVFYVPSNSMSPTIKNGERIVARKDSYRIEDPVVDELVVFRNPHDRQKTFVKRVVATAGQTVEMRDGAVFVDGVKRAEPEGIVSGGAGFAALVVPEFHCFVMGDNRANSKDSRHFGPVPYIALVGKVWNR